ncbi:hypothetical protein [Mycobacterium decipiens]|uniref:hypothetical protein n=1 Tax=Mycobacterium decipiens TaxID=1430326 RepID=UPI0013FD2DC8|nr:hypothetical protein [Mycobacterium decipiens]
MRGVITSLLLTALQRDTSGVDNNLLGVSGQVTAPGVLAFGHIFLTLSAGKDGRPQTPAEQFASVTAPACAADTTGHGENPVAADQGRHRDVQTVRA